MSYRTALTGSIGFVLLFTITACGGDGGTGPAGATRLLTKQGGDNQQAPAGQPVPVAPAVRVTNSAGAGVSGVAVIFAVGSGGGSITGGTRTTDADGHAAVGSWTLGAVAGANALTATIEGSTTTVTFAATGIAVPAALQKTAGDNQTAQARAAVAVRPAVRVVDALGNPVAGAVVIFAVTAGGGSVTGETQTTDANGLATVGAWNLGPTQGANHLTASLQGSSIAPVVFTAAGQEVVIQPAQDTIFAAGTLDLTRLVIPLGRTVTVSGNLVINADSSVMIAGTLQGNCVAITLNGAQTVTVTGAISNACTGATTDPPGLRIVARGGYTFTGPGEIVTSGDGEITNDPALTDADFPAAPPFAPADIRRIDDVAASHVACHVQKAFKVSAVAGNAPNGADGGPTGSNGENGRGWTLQCRGADLDLGAGAEVEGQHAGRGGNAIHTGNPGNAQAGHGGRGGNIKVRSTGRVVASAPVTVASGNGGDGGSATANGTAGVNGQQAAGATARAGNGGEPGLIEVRGLQGIVGAGNLRLKLGNAGTGGSATANGADGEQGKVPGASQREQDGGNADAEAGNGGDTPDKQLIQQGNVAGAPTMEGGQAGNGGASVASAGRGAEGTEQKPDGGHGGALRSVSGGGGNALARGLAGTAFGAGGNGGVANFLKGNGGPGWDNCVDLVRLPGRGGNGGAATGRDGMGGTGGAGMAGVPGGVVYAANSNGGQGGDHAVAPGDGGAAGGRTVVETGGVTEVDPIFTPGPKGNPCVEVITVTPLDLTFTHIVFVSPCPQPIGTVRVTNTHDVPVTITRAVTGTSVVTLSGGNNVVLQPSQFVDIVVAFNCAQAFSFSGVLQITGTPPPAAGPPQIIEVPIQGQVQLHAVRLAHPLGSFAVGSLIQRNRVTNWLFFGAHPPNCAVDHLHTSLPAGILIDGIGPFPDPDQPACGYGPIELVTLPPAPAGAPADLSYPVLPGGTPPAIGAGRHDH